MIICMAVKTEVNLRGRRHIALVGNPNVGKSIIFGLLTGQYVTVSNYPGTTVEVTRGQALFDRFVSLTTSNSNPINPLNPVV